MDEIIDLSPADDSARSHRQLLGREERRAPVGTSRDLVAGKRVLVTGAAGSIGSEIVRQVTRLGAGEVVLLDHDESRMHALALELSGSGLLTDDSVVLADIRDAQRVRRVFERRRPEIVYHAAAHKHLPLLERYPCEGVKTNVQATGHLVDAAVEHEVERFILISTDKAADPISVLGATKRLAEEVVRANGCATTRFGAVRFGNVLGSRGSFLETLAWQLQRGLPVTVTHPDVTRYFMTIPEAVNLVIDASAMAYRGETYVLDMGTPVRIVELVERYAALAGFARPQIVFSGLRDGEKLHEVLTDGASDCERTARPGVWRVRGSDHDSDLATGLALLYGAAEHDDDEWVRRALRDLLQMVGAAAPAERDELVV